MHNPAILHPLFTLGAWTFMVLSYMAILRLSSGLRPIEFALGESALVATPARLANRNYMNLLELPVLFYACGILLYLSGAATPAMQALAWIYVALRMAHSLIHLFYNNVLQRLLVFATSNFVLAGLWILAWLKLAA
jgi:hypothetical protein